MVGFGTLGSCTIYNEAIEFRCGADTFLVRIANGGKPDIANIESDKFFFVQAFEYPGLSKGPAYFTYRSGGAQHTLRAENIEVMSRGTNAMYETKDGAETTQTPCNTSVSVY